MGTTAKEFRENTTPVRSSPETPPKRQPKPGLAAPQPRGLCLALLMLGSVSGLLAQGGRSYGSSGKVWWDSGIGVLFPWEEDYDDPNGMISVLNANGAVRASGHAFFEPLGSNGRACITCHQPSNAMSVSVEAVRKQWVETKGKDPIFAAVDGSNCPDLPQQMESSHSLLLNRGLFRIALQWPPKNVTPEFGIEVVRDPTGCNTSAAYGLKSAHPAVSVFRRPRVTANLKYVIAGPEGLTFMADGREPSLEAQAISAAMTHEQAPKPTQEQLHQIVEFESQVYVAQSADLRGGMLNEKDAPAALGAENLRDGTSAPLAKNVSFDVWRRPNEPGDLQWMFRASVARGSDVFFRRRFRVGEASSTCATCHGAGTTRWMDIGTANRVETEAAPELPLFRITCDGSAAPHPSPGRVIYTQDPGRALISGKCADVGSIAMQQFRGLAARAPYFSNGSAGTIREIVDFYDRRYGIGLSKEEAQDLTNFLSVL